MPGIFVRVPEDGDVVEGIVVLDDVFEVDCCFAATVAVEVGLGGCGVVDEVDDGR